MQDSILIIDCFDKQHIVKIDNVKNIDSFYNNNAKKSITIVYLKELHNNLLDIRTYELEDSFRLRYSKVYDGLHKED